MRRINKRQLALILKYRLLWNQHAEWTKMAVDAIIFGTPNQEQVVNRLLQNPQDFAHALRPYYGPKLAERFSTLLTEHLTLAAQMIQAQMAGNQEEAERLKVLWYKNGDEIAAFLGKINPYWSYREWRKMFFTHLEYVEGLASTLLAGEYEKNIKLYDKFELEALEMADMMSCGIMRQFRRRFR